MTKPSRYQSFLLTLLISYMVFSSFEFFKLDLTDSGFYRFSPPAKKIIAEVKESVSIKLFLPDDSSKLPASDQRYIFRVKSLFASLESLSAGKIKITTYNPVPDSEDELLAKRLGLTPKGSFKGLPIYMTAVYEKAEDTLIYQNLDPDRERFLEYDIAETLQNLERDQLKTVAIYSALNILGGGSNKAERWAIFKSLERVFNLLPIDLTENIPDEVDSMILIHPISLEENQEYLIDQFLMKGGSIFIAFDPFSRVNHSRNRMSLIQGPSEDEEQASHPTKLFDQWGIRFEPSQVVGDVRRADKINTVTRTVNYPLLLRLNKDHIEQHHPISANTSNILLSEAGSFEVETRDGIEFRPIMQTSFASGVIATRSVYYLSPSELANKFSSDQRRRTLAGVLKGKFRSAFEKAPTGFPESEHLTLSKKISHIVIVSDTDFLDDTFTVEKIPYYDRLNMKAKNDNQDFFLNAMEFLAGNQKLLSIRSSATLQQRFERLAKLRQEKVEEFKQRTISLSAELQSIQDRLRKLVREENDNINRSGDNSRLIRELRDRESSLLKEKQQIDKESVKNLNRVRLGLHLINILGPTLFYLSLYYLYRRFSKYYKPETYV